MTSYIIGDFAGIAFVTDAVRTFTLAPGIPVTEEAIPTQTLLPSLITDTDNFYSATVVNTNSAASSLYIDTDTFHAPTITAGAVIFAPSLVVDADTFYVPSISTGIAPTTLLPIFYVDVDTFYAPKLIIPIFLAPSLVTDADIISAPNLGIDNRYIDVDIFYSFRSSAIVIPIWYRESDTIYPVSLVSRTTLFPPAFSADDVFYVPITGDRTLLPPFINADVVISLPVLARFNALLPPLVSATDVFFVPTILRSTITLRPSRVIDPDIFLSPIVGIVQVTDNPPGGDPANLPGNLKYVSKYIMAQSGLILSMDLQGGFTGIVNTRMVIYGDTGSLPGVLRGVSADKTSAVTGVNHYTLIAPVSVLAGDSIWMGLHSDGNFSWFLSNAPGGSKWNTDTWVGGATDPFGPVNNDNKKAPIVVYYLASSNAAITVDKVIDLDGFYPPTLAQINVLKPVLIVEEFFYTPLVKSLWMLALTLHIDDDVFYAPARTGAATLHPALFGSDDTFYSPFLAKFAPTVFSAAMPHDDLFYPPTVVDYGATLLPQRVADTDIVYPPQRSGLNGIAPPVLSAPDVFFTPLVSKGAVTLAPPVLDSGIDFYLPVISVIGGAKIIKPSLVIDNDVFYRPRKSGNPGWRKQVYILGSEAKDISIVGEIPTPELVE